MPMTTFSVRVSMYSGLVSTVSGKHLSIYSGLTAKMCLLISGKDTEILQMTIVTNDNCDN